MKKLIILGLSITMFCPFAISETIYLYKQTKENTLPTGETVTNTHQTTVTTGQNGGNVYKIKANNNNLNEGETVLRTETLGSPKNTKKNKIKNTYGKNQDYITATSNKDGNQDLNRLQRLIAKINDPYVIKIDGFKYYLVKNSNDGRYTLNNILGYGDSKTSLFSSLIALNTNNDAKITNNELKNANVRFVELDSYGKLQVNNPQKDFTDILYIDLSTIRESVNTANMIGSFGYFDVYVKDKYGATKKIIGYISFDSDEELMEMLK